VLFLDRVIHYYRIYLVPIFCPTLVSFDRSERKIEVSLLFGKAGSLGMYEIYSCVNKSVKVSFIFFQPLPPGVMDWAGHNSIPVELWLLPDWFPFHPAMARQHRDRETPVEPITQEDGGQARRADEQSGYFLQKRVIEGYIYPRCWPVIFLIFRPTENVLFNIFLPAEKGPLCPLYKHRNPFAHHPTFCLVSSPWDINTDCWTLGSLCQCRLGR